MTNFHNGRKQAVALASMNVRAIVGEYELIYIGRDPRLGTVPRGVVGARFQPRNALGQFVSYAAFWEAVNLEYSMTAFDCDVEDEGGWPDFFDDADDVDGTDHLFSCDDVVCPHCRP